MSAQLEVSDYDFLGLTVLFTKNIFSFDVVLVRRCVTQQSGFSFSLELKIRKLNLVAPPKLFASTSDSKTCQKLDQRRIFPLKTGFEQCTRIQTLFEFFLHCSLITTVFVPPSQIAHINEVFSLDLVSLLYCSHRSGFVSVDYLRLLSSQQSNRILFL